MPTTIITGRDLVLTIATTSYDAQATSATLTNSPTIETYQTLDGKAYKRIDDQWTFDVEMLADWALAVHYAKRFGQQPNQHQTRRWQCH